MVVQVRQQPYIHQETQEVQQNPLVQPKKKRKLVTTKEKTLYIAFVVMVAILSISILYRQSKIQQTNIEIQQIEKEVAEIEKQNVDLKVQVNELSTYERILEKAKALGLTLNEKNVKVVPGE